ncbi:MAG TPA: protein phosphatase 2C domain-containing protein, partial [Planctomycetaceae bacterium]|nr:protein phosphatase 2C domain-containing protein [Planctomycetaceae bacterium]
FSTFRRWFSSGQQSCVMQIRAGSKTITGKRSNNEDNLHADPDQRYFLVADGMGGQSAGEKASALAMEIIPQQLAKLDWNNASSDQAVRAIDTAIAAANSEILALGELDPRFHNMGTTVTFLVRAGDGILVGGVGDSRTYLLRNGKLELLTTDHSLVQALLDAGTITPDEALTHRYKNVLYRYLGEKTGGNPTSPRHIEIRPGDRYVLCTDGVTGSLNELHLAQILGSGNDPNQIAEQIVQAAYDMGSQDNITCIVVLVDGA